MIIVTTAFVLSGGASLGSIQVGMLQAMSRAGLRPDLLVGSSVGALNAAWVAGDPSPESVDHLAGLWTRIDRNDIFPFQPLRGFLGFVGRQPSLITNSGLRRILSEHLVFERLEEALVPVHAVVVDALSGRDVRLSRGDAVDAITASAAIPGVFPPVVIEGRPYMDGGVVNNTPISHAYDLGADTIWVLPAGYACAMEETPQSSLGMALHGLSLLVQQRLAVDVARFGPVVDLRVVPPLCPVTASPADFRQSAELIERARTSTEKWLADPTPPDIDQEGLVRPHAHG